MRGDGYRTTDHSIPATVTRLSGVENAWWVRCFAEAE
jgi:hypothetical protein